MRATAIATSLAEAKQCVPELLNEAIDAAEDSMAWPGGIHVGDDVDAGVSSGALHPSAVSRVRALLLPGRPALDGDDAA